jgi:hypothetical protein
MSKKLIIVLAALVAVAFAGVAIAAAPAGELIVKNAKGEGKKTPAKFTHDSEGHKVLKCVDCHHEAKDAAAEAAIKGCNTCHGVDPKAKGDVMAKNNENPYHKNCVADCHKAKQKGPTKCKECHPGGAEE